MLKVVIDAKICCGTTNCVEEAPEAFDMDERGVAHLKNPAASDEELLRAAEACPVGAISLFDSQGRRVYP